MQGNPCLEQLWLQLLCAMTVQHENVRPLHDQNGFVGGDEIKRVCQDCGTELDPAMG